MTSPAPLAVRRPALGSLELASIARGIVVLDQMAKRAETTIVAARTISPGRYWILVSGEVAEVGEAMTAAIEAAREDLVAQLVLADPSDALRAALASELPLALDESLAIVETTTLAAALLGLDRAVKDAGVAPLELRLGAGLTGKGVFTLTGPLHLIEAARDTITAVLEPAQLVRIELIAQPHPDLPSHLLEAEAPWVRGPSGRPR